MAQSATTTNQGTPESEYIVDLNDNDVLLGRGQPILNYSGNVRFRKLIQERKEQYTSTGKHAVKDQIARQVLEAIEARGGRFVRKVDESERDEFRVPDQVLHAWRIVDEQTRLSKVKQALREQVGKETSSSGTGQKSKKTPRTRSSSDENPPPSMMEATRRQQNFIDDAQRISSAKRARSVDTAMTTGNSTSRFDPLVSLPHHLQNSAFSPSLFGGNAALGFTAPQHHNQAFYPPTGPMTMRDPSSSDAATTSSTQRGLQGFSSFPGQQDFLQHRILLQQQRQQALELQRRHALESVRIIPPWSLETAVQQYLLTQQRMQQDHLLLQQQAFRNGAEEKQNSKDDDDDGASSSSSEDKRRRT